MPQLLPDFRIFEVGVVAGHAVLTVEPAGRVIPVFAHLHGLTALRVEHGVAAQHADEIALQRTGEHRHDLFRVYGVVAEPAVCAAPVMQPADRGVARVNAELHGRCGVLISEDLCNPLVGSLVPHIEHRRIAQRVGNLLRHEQIMPRVRNAVVREVQRIAERLLGLCLPLQNAVVLLDAVNVAVIASRLVRLADELPVSLQKPLNRAAVYFHHTLTPPFLLNCSATPVVASGASSWAFLPSF